MTPILEPSVDLLYPDSNQVFNAAIDYDITWESQGQIQNVLLEYSMDGGQTWVAIDTVPNTGSYTWDLPHVNSRQCYVRISDPENPEVKDASDSPFTILTTFINQPGSIVAWGSNRDGQCDVPGGKDYIAIASGYYHVLALKSNGSLVGWGINDYGQSNVPKGEDFIAVSAGDKHSLALKSDGSIVAWGRNEYGQATSPEGKDFVTIAAGAYHNLALRKDGTIVAWGNNAYGLSDIPTQEKAVSIAADHYQNLALLRDGTLIGWGSNHHGQANVPEGNDFKSIAAGSNFNLAIRNDGSLIGWGFNYYGQTNVPEGNDFIDIEAGGQHGLALRIDGSLSSWGKKEEGQCNIPLGNNFITIAVGDYHSLAIISTYEFHELWYVDNVASGANNGTSWADAFLCLQDALMFAGDGDEIWVAEGIQRPDQFVLSDRAVRGRLETYQLKSGVAIYGGFPSGGGTWGQRNPKLHETILSGDLAGNDTPIDNPSALRNAKTRTDNCYHVVTGSGTDTTAILDGFTIQGGNADSWEKHYHFGGGMYNGSGNPTVHNCVFRENTAQYGGGMGNNYSDPFIENCLFIDNEAIRKGGGVYAFRSNPKLSFCEFRNNTVEMYYGGGFYNDTSNSTLLNCLFANNIAPKGGGIYNDRTSEMELKNCTLSRNSATQQGGGIYDSPEAMSTLKNCILWENTDETGQTSTAQIMSEDPDINHSTLQNWYGLNPLFADPDHGDFHLRSYAGRWIPTTQSWYSDNTTSPAIDAGSPFDSVGDEPIPNGNRINQGAYGGTAQASMSLSGQFNIADLNKDGIVDICDLSIMAENWLKRNE